MSPLEKRFDSIPPDGVVDTTHDFFSHPLKRTRLLQHYLLPECSHGQTGLYHSGYQRDCVFSNEANVNVDDTSNSCRNYLSLHQPSVNVSET